MNVKQDKRMLSQFRWASASAVLPQHASACGVRGRIGQSLRCPMAWTGETPQYRKESEHISPYYAKRLTRSVCPHTQPKRNSITLNCASNCERHNHCNNCKSMKTLLTTNTEPWRPKLPIWTTAACAALRAIRTVRAMPTMSTVIPGTRGGVKGTGQLATVARGGGTRGYCSTGR